MCLHPLGCMIKYKIQRLLLWNKFKLRAEQQQFFFGKAHVTVAESPREIHQQHTHCPPGTQANVSPLDCSNICLMDVFGAQRAI